MARRVVWGGVAVRSNVRGERDRSCNVRLDSRSACRRFGSGFFRAACRATDVDPMVAPRYD